MTSLQKKLLWWLGSGFIVACLFGNQGFRSLVGEIRDKQRLTIALARLRAEHDRLTREVAAIQHDPSYTEYLVRKHLGYVKKGEVEYRLMNSDKKH